MNDEWKNMDFERVPLVPAVVQDVDSGTVLMLGYMNREALRKTMESGRVTFFSRSRQRLWTKGETSGNFLLLEEIYPDCDQDALLVRARPTGPTCHTGTTSCFGITRKPSILEELEQVIRRRRGETGSGSYCASLFAAGVGHIARKVGEEAVEVVVEAMGEKNRHRFLEECADLVFHLLVLLAARGCSFRDVLHVLVQRRSGGGNP